MLKQLLIAVFLILISTLTYYIPNYVVDIRVIDKSLVQKEFYDFFAWKLAGCFLLNALYAIILFIYINPKHLVLKIALCWLAIAESATFLMHIHDKFYRNQPKNETQAVIVLIIFTICCLFLLKRAIFKQKSDFFNPSRTYIINFLPKNTLGILNYIINKAGHKAIYQDLIIYKFNTKTEKVEKKLEKPEFFHRNDITFTEIPEISDINRLIGKKYKRFSYNCNHLVRDATRIKTD